MLFRSLVEAVELVQQLVAEPVGGDGHGDDEQCPRPRNRWDAWSEACSDEERRLDLEELAADGWAGETHCSEGEAGGDEEEACRAAYLKGYVACQLASEQVQEYSQAH